jgi:glycosyltransferase involved in cell wall biosynthesis
LTLLSAARIVPEKRFDRFISAVGRLRQKCEVDLRAWIAGPAQDSCLRQELEAQASWLGLLPGRLQFLGAVSRMDPLYQQADICVLTSDFEGTPNVLMEAMASGLPVVATRVGGVPEIVSHGKTGFVVDRDDAEGLLAALQKLALNPELRLQMGQRAREYVETNHSLDRLPTFLDELYEWALPPRRPGSLGFIKEIPA